RDVLAADRLANRLGGALQLAARRSDSILCRRKLACARRDLRTSPRALLLGLAHGLLALSLPRSRGFVPLTPPGCRGVLAVTAAGGRRVFGITASPGGDIVRLARRPPGRALACLGAPGVGGRPY